MNSERGYHILREETGRWIVLVTLPDNEGLSVTIRLLTDDKGYAYVFQTFELAQHFIEWLQQ